VKVLLDENMPHQLRAHFSEHETATAAYPGSSGWKNGRSSRLQPIILHSGVASRSILSRTYQWRDFSVPTWTFIPSKSWRS
jgi:hypothetical protein